MGTLSDAPKVEFRSRRAIREWLEANHESAGPFWLVTFKNLVIPDDLADALARNRRAGRNFEAFNASARKIILMWLKTAKRAETRQKRVRETVRLAAKNIKAAHPEARGQ